jgi:hypothetical protein
MPYSAKDACEDTIVSVQNVSGGNPRRSEEALTALFAAKQLLGLAQFFATVWENQENQAEGARK